MADQLIPVRIVARGRDRSGGIYFRVIALLAGKDAESILAFKDFQREPTVVMARLGIVTEGAKTAFKNLLQDAIQRELPTFRVIIEAGWYKTLFILPDERVIGARHPQPVCLPTDPATTRPAFATMGRLSGWQALCRLAVGNTRMQMVLALAFCGPVITLLGVEIPMIQLVGDQNLGKSTLGMVAASVWGNPRRFVRSWNATNSSIEEVARGHSASFLVLEDTSTFDWSQTKAYDNLRNTVHRLAEGHTKGRFREASPLFRVPVLSTSNETLDAMAIRARIGIDAKQRAATSRLNDVDLPAGAGSAFENLHGHATHPGLVEQLCEIVAVHHGFAGIGFVRRLQAWCAHDEPGLRAWLKESRSRYLRVATRLAGTRPDLERIHQKFATIYAAGALAIQFGIITDIHLRELGESILACERAHIALIDRATPAEDKPVAATTTRQAVHRHVRERRASLVDLRRGLISRNDHDHRTCDGYINERNGELELLFAAAKFEDICGGRTLANALKRELGSVLLGGERRDVVKRAIYRDGGPDDRVHVIALRAAAFNMT